MEFELFNFKERFSEREIIYYYCGSISQNLIESMGKKLRRKMQLYRVNTATELKVFAVFIEMIQNICHYSVRPITKKGEPGRAEGVIVVANQNGSYYINSGNVITNSEGLQIKKKILKVQQMNKIKLKEHYKKQRRTPPDASSKGAGLGFIEIARKTNKFEVEITEMDKDYSFVSIWASIDSPITKSPEEIL